MRAIVLVAALCVSIDGSAQAPTLRERLAERIKERRAQAGTERIADVAYGADPAQVFDVYRPAGARRAPVIVMVHGGAWRTGDKANGGVIDNKVRHWTGQGYLVVSVNYRLLPTPVAQQLDDVALAVDTVRRRAAEWGGDGANMALVGHSAGAHLVALLNARTSQGPWRAVVALDSAAFDVEAIMRERHARLYDEAFGADPNLWRALSPYAQLAGGARPLLAVCSTGRDDACPQADRYAAKARSLGDAVEVMPVDLGHREINVRLGADVGYTAAVDRFLAAQLAR